MSSSGIKYNKGHSAIKRIMSEIQEMSQNPSSDYIAHPLDDNLFEWHFTVRGPQGTAFEGGVYHGRIILPAEYPYKPPDIMLLTVCC
jgi:ubiquitin-conjugating enzyme E2 J1